MDWIQEPLFLACMAYFIGTATPGPSTLLVATTSMRYGQRTGLINALGASFGAAALGIAVTCGVAALLSDGSPWAQPLRIAGGLYLIWLAIQSVRSAVSSQSIEDTSAVHKGQSQRTFTQGFLINAINPHAMLSWLACVAIGTSAAVSFQRPTLLIVIVGICTLLSIVIFCGYAIAFAHPRAMEFYKGWRRRIDLMAATLFTTAGMILIF